MIKVFNWDLPAILADFDTHGAKRLMGAVNTFTADTDVERVYTIEQRGSNPYRIYLLYTKSFGSVFQGSFVKQITYPSNIVPTTNPSVFDEFKLSTKILNDFVLDSDQNP